MDTKELTAPVVAESSSLPELADGTPKDSAIYFGNPRELSQFFLAIASFQQVK